MASLNKVMLIGNVTRDPEVKFTPKGSAVADLGLAINRSYTTKPGKRSRKSLTSTWNFGAAWRKLPESTPRRAGLFIEGRLRMDSWEDKQSGQKRNRLEVVGEGLQLLGSRPQAEVSPQRTRGAPRLKAIPTRACAVHAE